MSEETQPKPAETAENSVPDKKGKKTAKAKGAPSGNRLKAMVAGMSSREQMILKVAGLVLCLVTIDLVIVRPVSGFLRKLDDMIRVEEEVIPKQLQILKYKEGILREYQALKPFFTDPKITQEEETARFLREIERVSKEVGLFVSNINPVRIDKKSEDLYFLAVDIEGKGPIGSVRQFMRSLEFSNPSIRVSSFNLKPQGKESDELKYSFSIVKIGVKEAPSAAVQVVT